MRASRLLPLVPLTLMAGCGPSNADKQAGAWAGDLQLCATTVAKVERDFDQQTHGPLIRITLKPEYTDDLEQMTASLVGEPIEVRVNGAPVVAPIIAEPITVGAFEVVGAAPGQLSDLAAQALRPC